MKFALWYIACTLVVACLVGPVMAFMKRPTPVAPVAPVPAAVAVEEELYYESFRVQDNRLLAVIVDRKTGTRTLLVVVYQGVALSPLPLPKVVPGH